MNELVQREEEQEILDSEHAGPPTLSVRHSSSGRRGISLFLLFLSLSLSLPPLSLSLFFLLFFFFFSLFYVFWKWWPRVEGIKRRMSPLFQVLPPWKAAKSGSISFKIRTNEPNGLIMYSRSGAHTRVRWFDRPFSSSPFFWREIIVNTGIIRTTKRQSVDNFFLKRYWTFLKFTTIYSHYITWYIILLY